MNAYTYRGDLARWEITDAYTHEIVGTVCAAGPAKAMNQLLAEQTLPAGMYEVQPSGLDGIAPAPTDRAYRRTVRRTT